MSISYIHSSFCSSVFSGVYQELLFARELVLTFRQVWKHSAQENSAILFEKTSEFLMIT